METDIPKSLCNELSYLNTFYLARDNERTDKEAYADKYRGAKEYDRRIVSRKVSKAYDLKDHYEKLPAEEHRKDTSHH